MPPPSILRKRRARSTSSRLPAITEPTGAPSPFEKQADTVSNGAASSRSGHAAGDRRVPDARAVEVQREAARAGARRDRGELRARPDAAAAAVVRVLDRDQPRARQVAIVGQRRRVDVGAGERAVGAADLGELHARPRPRRRPIRRGACARRARRSPRRRDGSAAAARSGSPSSRSGTNSAASLPSSSAARSSSARAVGSSPHTSSPTSAPAIAARIAGVGFVNVSDRRSTITAGLAGFAGRASRAPPAPARSRRATTWSAGRYRNCSAGNQPARPPPLDRGR